MNKKRSERKDFDASFKLEAVRMVKDQGLRPEWIKSSLEKVHK